MQLARASNVLVFAPQAKPKASEISYIFVELTVCLSRKKYLDWTWCHIFLRKEDVIFPGQRLTLATGEKADLHEFAI